MKHNYIAIDVQQDTRIDIGWRNAYHQAGHAAAICLANRRKQLPPVYFQISINPQEHDRQPVGRFAGVYSKYTVKVEGGRLIQNLPMSFAEATQHLSWFQQAEYRCAFEADVINLLAGSLAEAKHVASRDGEAFNANLINLRALRFYGDSSEIELVNEYMECFMPHKVERKQKLAELFLLAFGFVNEASNWRYITALAEFIGDQPQGIVHCEEVISLLDSGITSYKAHPLALQTNEICK